MTLSAARLPNGILVTLAALALTQTQPQAVADNYGSIGINFNFRNAGAENGDQPGKHRETDGDALKHQKSFSPNSKNERLRIAMETKANGKLRRVATPTNFCGRLFPNPMKFNSELTSAKFP